MNLNKLNEALDSLKKDLSEESSFDIANKQRMKKLKELNPRLYGEFIKDGNDEINSVSLITTPLKDLKKIYFIETPGHGWYYDDNGSLLGEEDGGLDDKETMKELGLYSLSGKACEIKEIIG